MPGLAVLNRSHDREQKRGLIFYSPTKVPLRGAGVKRKRPVLNSGIGVMRKNRMYGTAELSAEARRNATPQAAATPISITGTENQCRSQVTSLRHAPSTTERQQFHHTLQRPCICRIRNGSEALGEFIATTRARMRPCCQGPSLEDHGQRAGSAWVEIIPR